MVYKLELGGMYGVKLACCDGWCLCSSLASSCFSSTDVSSDSRLHKLLKKREGNLSEHGIIHKKS